MLDIVFSKTKNTNLKAKIIRSEILVWPKKKNLFRVHRIEWCPRVWHLQESPDGGGRCLDLICYLNCSVNTSSSLFETTLHICRLERCKASHPKLKEIHVPVWLKPKILLQGLRPRTMHSRMSPRKIVKRHHVISHYQQWLHVKFNPRNSARISTNEINFISF